MRGMLIALERPVPKLALPPLSNRPMTGNDWPSSVRLPLNEPVDCTVAVNRPSVAMPACVGDVELACTSPLYVPAMAVNGFTM